MKVSIKKSTLITLTMWIVSFILSFSIPPSNPFIWLPDALLLLGFWPLFFGMQARVFWLVFGICDMFIGFVLFVGLFFPAEALAPYHMVAMKEHMKLYHSHVVWFLIGLVSTIIGVVACLKSLSAWIYERAQSGKKSG